MFTVHFDIYLMSPPKVAPPTVVHAHKTVTMPFAPYPKLRVGLWPNSGPGEDEDTVEEVMWVCGTGDVHARLKDHTHADREVLGMYLEGGWEVRPFWWEVDETGIDASDYVVRVDGLGGATVSECDLPFLRKQYGDRLVVVREPLTR